MEKGINLILFFIFLVFPSHYIAQNIPDYEQRDSLINSLLKSEDFPNLIKEVDRHISDLKSAGLVDSVYKYAYPSGVAHWKNKGPEAGMVRMEQLVEFVIENDPDTSHHLTVLTDLSWIYFEVGSSDRCMEADQRFLEVCKVYSNATADQHSIAYYNLGYNYTMQGNGKLAALNFKKSIIPLLEDSVKHAERLVNSYNSLGAAYFRLGSYREGKAAFKESLKFINLLDNAFAVHSNKSNCLNNLSLIAHSEGDLILAKQYIEEAIAERKLAIGVTDEIYEKGQQDRHLMAAYNNLSSIYTTIGDFERSRQIIEYVYKYRLRTLEKGDPDIYLSLENLGNISMQLGEYNTALEYFQIFKEFCYRHYGRESFHTAAIEQSMAELNVLRGENTKAVALFTTAIAIFKVISENHNSQDLANAYIKRAEAYSNDHKPREAENDLMNAIEIYKNTRDRLDPSIGNTYIKLAALELNYGDILTASSYIDSALFVLKNYQQKLNSFENNRLNKLVLYLPEAYYIKALIHLKVDSSRYNLEAALDNLDKAILLLRQTQEVFGGESAVTTLYDAHAKVFKLTQDLCFKLYALSKDQKYFHRMLRMSEESKNIMLRRRLNHFSSVRFSNIPDSLVEKERLLVGQLTGKIFIDSLIDIYTIEREYEGLLKLIQNKYPEYYKLRYSTKVPDLKTIRNELLNDKITLLEYIVTKDNVYAIVITSTSENVIPLHIPKLKEAIVEYNSAIKANNSERFYKISTALYTQLFLPLEKYLKGDQLLIIPDNELLNLNFESLIAPGKAGKASYLIYRYTISYLLSASTAIQFQNLDRKNSKAALAIAPGFSDDLKQEYSVSLKDSSLSDPNYLRQIQQPFALETAREMAALFSGDLYIEERATESNFKENVSEFSIIHFGTHTEINNASPLLSRLVLSKSTSTEASAEDGYLHAYEIYNIPLSASLAVLTACETGIGKQSYSEGAISLAHSFAYAGCPSVIMSLWRIDEKSSSTIIEDFYINLKNGMSKNEALRWAKVAYLNKNEGSLTNPYYWAGMVLVGDVGPVKENSPKLYFYIIPGILLLLIIILIFFFKRRAALKTSMR